MGATSSRAEWTVRTKSVRRGSSVLVGVTALSAAAFTAPTAGAAGAAGAAATGGGVEYTFTKVLDSADGYDPFSFGCAAMNNRGDIVTKADRIDPEDEFNTIETIVRANADGGLRTIVDEDADGFRLLGRNPKINDVRQVSFWADLQGSGGEVIARRRSGPITVIARTEPVDGQGGEYEFFGVDTTINVFGTVAFRGELDNADLGMWSGRGGAITTHYLDSEGRFDGRFAGVSINDLGQIAFEESQDGDNGMFRGRQGRFVTIADEPGAFFDPSVNELGRVAFYQDNFVGDEQVFAVVTGRGGPLTTVADTTGPFSSFGFRGPSINNRGDVAFLAELDSFEFPPPHAIFTGPDVVDDRVIGSGDTLDGDTISSLTFCEEALNSSGQLAFTAFFEDPDTFELRTAVFRATPVPR